MKCIDLTSSALTGALFFGLDSLDFLAELPLLPLSNIQQIFSHFDNKWFARKDYSYNRQSEKHTQSSQTIWGLLSMHANFYF
jgi:hypothetical protein